MTDRPTRAVAIVLALAVSAVGCTESRSTDAVEPASASSSSSPSSASSAEQHSQTPCGPGAAAAITHVIWIWMENHSADAVLGNADAPFTNGIAAQCASSSSYRAVGSPSLPNYIAATSGDTAGITDDAPPDRHPLTADNVFRQVRTSGRTSRSYQENMPAPCDLVSHGRYAVKHNPAAYYVGADDRDACRRDDVPLGDTTKGALLDDLAHDALPAFAFVTPDLCNDTHDCPVNVGDNWLAEWLPVMVSSPAYQRGDTVIFVVWDEPTPMPFVAIARGGRAGARLDGPFDHYSLLRTTEEILNLPLLGHAGTATSMRSALGL